MLPIPGVLTGICIGAASTRDTPYVFVLGCDMPFLTPKAILYTIDQVHDEQIIVPRTEAGFEPIHAVYHRSCLSALLTA